MAGHFASGLRGPCSGAARLVPRRGPRIGQRGGAGHRSGPADVNFHGHRAVSVLARGKSPLRCSAQHSRLTGSDPAGVSVPHILLHARAFLRLMTSDETACRRADDAVMAGIVAGDTADDRAFQTTLG